MTDIKFNNKWNVWYHHTLDDWTANGYKMIFTIETMADFWNFHNNINCIGGITNLHYCLFRDGIVPNYEDRRNRYGGSWSVLIPTDHAYEVWEDIAIRLVGETLTSNPIAINGITINMKSEMCTFRIWNSSKSNYNINQLPNIPHRQSSINYKPHPIKKRY
jgi:translation initiation factor 4E